MAVYLLDTDTLTLHQHGHPLVTARVVAHARTGVVGLTVEGVEEQVTGWLASVRKARTPADRAKASRFGARLVGSWSGFTVVPTAVAAVAVHEQLVRLRLNIGKGDLRIAAVALDFGATLVTRNRRDFARVPNLPLTDWSV